MCSITAGLEYLSLPSVQRLNISGFRDSGSTPIDSPLSYIDHAPNQCRRGESIELEKSNNEVRS